MQIDYSFFPCVCLCDFSLFIQKKIDRYVIDFSHYQYLKELEGVPRQFRRKKQVIEYHCRSGITKEVAFALIHGLNPFIYIDFEVHGGADKFDLEIGESRIDVTTATKVINFDQKNDMNSFELEFVISRDKYESIKNRSAKTYLVNEIAFLKQYNQKIYYLGQIDKDKFLKLESEIKEIRGKCHLGFHVEGKKELKNPLLINEIVLV